LKGGFQKDKGEIKGGELSVRMGLDMDDPKRKRRSSIETIQLDAPVWVSSHPLKPIFPLAWKLLKFVLGTGPQWFLRILSMILFIVLLLPAFIQVGWYYITSPDILRNIKYGPNPRNYLDIYLPAYNNKYSTPGKRPVVIFLSGGVWIIGYKAWGAFTGKILASYGILTVQPDYRNFPQGCMPEMLEDSNRAISWVSQNIASFGGNQKEIYLMGQSAGSHMGALLLLYKALQEKKELDKQQQQQQQRQKEQEMKQRASTDADSSQENLQQSGGADDDKPEHEQVASEERQPEIVKSNGNQNQGNGRSNGNHHPKQNTPQTKRNPLIPEDYVENFPGPEVWELLNIKSFIGIAGPYNISAIENHFHQKGLPRRLLHAIFGGRQNLRSFSPFHVLQDHLHELSDPAIRQRIPPFVLLHGTADKSVPFAMTQEFDHALAKAGLESFVKLYPDQTHTDVIIEDIICPDNKLKDDLMFDVIVYVTHRLQISHDSDVEKVLPKQQQHLTFLVPNEEKFKTRNIRPNLLPRFAVNIAKKVNPF